MGAVWDQALQRDPSVLRLEAAVVLAERLGLNVWLRQWLPQWLEHWSPNHPERPKRLRQWLSLAENPAGNPTEIARDPPLRSVQQRALLRSKVPAPTIPELHSGQAGV